MKNLNLKRATSLVLALSFSCVMAASYANNGTNPAPIEKECSNEDSSDIKPNDASLCESFAFIIYNACKNNAYDRSSAQLCNSNYQADLKKCN